MEGRQNHDAAPTPTQWMDILEMRADWEHEKPLARVVLDRGQIRMIGDADFIAVLENGIPDASNQMTYPKDGQRFLEAARTYFSDPPHLFSSRISTGDQVPYTPSAWKSV